MVLHRKISTTHFVLVPFQLHMPTFYLQSNNIEDTILCSSLNRVCVCMFFFKKKNKSNQIVNTKSLTSSMVQIMATMLASFFLIIYRMRDLNFRTLGQKYNLYTNLVMLLLTTFLFLSIYGFHSSLFMKSGLEY